MNASASKSVTLLVGLIAPMLALIVRLMWQSEVPDPLPTHWNADGAVNGTTGAAALFGWSSAISLVLVLVSGILLFHRRAQDSARLLVTILISSAWLVSGIYVMSMVLARNAEKAQEVKLPWYALVLTIAIPLAVGAAIWSVLPKPTMTAPQSKSPSLVMLSATERVVWISHAHSIALRILAVTLAVAAAVLAFFSALPAAIVLLVSVLIAFTSEITVRIDDQGLHTIWGPIGWPRPVIHLDAIAGVQAEHISPMKRGGWGYRITSSGTAANIRSGPGIVVQKTNGNAYVVTVDDANEGAAVLSALLRRGTRSGR